MYVVHCGSNVVVNLPLVFRLTRSARIDASSGWQFPWLVGSRSITCHKAISDIAKERPGTRNAGTRPRRGKTSLRGAWQRARAATNPRLFLDIGDVEGPDRSVVERSSACLVGHAGPRSIRLPRRPRGL